mmetsp:Transcript_4027/g.9170  ORF Transcript_4027/g.9170 Transcript_4027/m.9170 type:complete len:82 (-) Transcript_4027:447-692(-)
MRFLLLITVRAYSAWLFAVMIAENHLRDNWYGWAAFLTAIVKLERRDRIEASELQADKALLLTSAGSQSVTEINDMQCCCR